MAEKSHVRVEVYDFGELILGIEAEEVAGAEGVDSQVREAAEMLVGFAGGQIVWPRPESFLDPACTGLTARWCPAHGDCTCPRDPGIETDMDDEGCPLHGSESDHPVGEWTDV